MGKISLRYRHMESGTRHGRASRNESGFTIIEVVAVLITLGILTLVAVSHSNDLDLESSSETALIKSRLRYAQTRAMNSSEAWGVKFEGTSYFLFSNGNTVNRDLFPGESSDSVTLPSGLTVTPSNVIISFDSWGRPHTDAQGQVAQNSTKVLRLNGPDGSRNITIYKNTGFIP